MTNLISGICSVVNDIMNTEEEVKKGLEKLQVLISKAENSFKFTQFDSESDLVEMNYIGKRLNRTKETFRHYKKLVDKGLGIKDKLTMNLPFKNTKQSIKEAIAEIQQVISELKQKQPSQTQPFKRQLSNTRDSITTDLLPTLGMPNNEAFAMLDPTLQVHPIPMAPTIEDYQVENTVNNKLRLTLTFQTSDPKHAERLKKEKKLLHKQDFFHTFPSDVQASQSLFVFNRKWFALIIAEASQIFKEINYISANSTHFEIIARQKLVKPSSQAEKQNYHSELQTIIVSAAKQSMKKPQKNNSENEGSQRQSSAPQFFSFPQDHVGQILGKTFCGAKPQNVEYFWYCKAGSKGAFVKGEAQGSIWERIMPNEERQLKNGDCVAAMMRMSDNKLPNFWYKVEMEVIAQY